MNETRTLARFVVETRFADLPTRLVDNCKIAVLDAIVVQQQIQIDRARTPAPLDGAISAELAFDPEKRLEQRGRPSPTAS